MQKNLVLPTIPTVAIRVLEAFGDINTPICDIVDAVKADPAITAKLLKAANSPLYGGDNVDSLDRAVVWLGKHAVTCLALSFSLAEQAQTDAASEKHYQRYWLQSVVQAVSMELLAKQQKVAPAGAAFVAGLLMDIGRLALFQSDQANYVEMLDNASDQLTDICELEQETFDTTHASISAEMLESWGLPASTINVARYHTLPVAELMEISNHEDFALIAAGNVAAATGDFLCGTRAAASLDRLQSLADRLYGLDDSALDEYLKTIRTRLDETASLFSTEPSSLPSTTELLASAMGQLAVFSLRSVEATAPAQGSRVLQQENEDLRSRISELEKRTCIDDLTQVYTREYFARRLHQRLSSCTNPWTQTAVLFIDGDKFKRINDTYGHLAGDEVLKLMAAATREVVRGSDVVARYGGEEFVVLLDDPDISQVEHIAERIRSNVEQQRLQFGEHELKATVSVGGVLTVGLPAGDNTSFQDQLLEMADKAMYAAKAAGGNDVILREFVYDAAHGDKQLQGAT